MLSPVRRYQIRKTCYQWPFLSWKKPLKKHACDLSSCLRVSQALLLKGRTVHSFYDLINYVWRQFLFLSLGAAVEGTCWRIWYTIDIISWKQCQGLFVQIIAKRLKWLSVIIGKTKETKQIGMKYAQIWDKKVMLIYYIGSRHKAFNGPPAFQTRWKFCITKGKKKKQHQKQNSSRNSSYWNRCTSTNVYPKTLWVNKTAVPEHHIIITFIKCAKRVLETSTWLLYGWNTN